MQATESLSRHDYRTFCMPDAGTITLVMMSYPASFTWRIEVDLFDQSSSLPKMAKLWDKASVIFGAKLQAYVGGRDYITHKLVIDAPAPKKVKRLSRELAYETVLEIWPHISRCELPQLINLRKA